MKRNNFFSRFIVVTLTAALLLMSGSRAIPVSALAVGPLADPVYDTEIIAFKDYVEQNLDAPQLDIMFFLIGGLAVAQMGAQDAMLISPYPNEENVKEWIINCGIQLYNSVIGLVPEGDYYMGIPSIGSAGQRGVPRQVIKGLVAQMMGDAVVAINYPDLDTFLEENPNELYIPFNKDLQLGVNAVFGLNNGLFNWQHDEFIVTPDYIPFSWTYTTITNQNYKDTYDSLVATLSDPKIFFNTPSSADDYNCIASGNLFTTYNNIFINTTTGKAYLVDAGGNYDFTTQIQQEYVGYNTTLHARKYNLPLKMHDFDVSLYSDPVSLVEAIGTIANTLIYRPNTSAQYVFAYKMFVQNIYIGDSWANKQPLNVSMDLNIANNMSVYYDELQNDYLLDIRGLIGDLVNYVYVRNPVFDNIYDYEGNNIVPILVKISTAIENITELIAPPVPVNLNDIAELTDNTYLERVKEHARNAGDIFANYVAFWHNCDSDLVYTMFGAAILVLVGAFVGKWGHS